MNERAHNRISKAMADYSFADSAWRDAVKREAALKKERDRLHAVMRAILAEESIRIYEIKKG